MHVRQFHVITSSRSASSDLLHTIHVYAAHQWYVRGYHMPDLAPEASQHLLFQLLHLPLNGSLDRVSGDCVAAKLHFIGKLFCVSGCCLQQATAVQMLRAVKGTNIFIR